MHIISWFLILLYTLLFSCNLSKKKKIIDKLKRMETWEKVYLLKKILNPFGFIYSLSSDVITSTIDSWQRSFGYTALYDRTAIFFNMLLDFEPVYFYYQGKTWLVEFWKGQYGINIGAEVGIYFANGEISPEHYRDTVFESVPDKEMLPLSIELFHKGRQQFFIKKKHWWLTGFKAGCFGEPRDMTMNVSITFLDGEMLEKFQEAMLQRGYLREEFQVSGNTISFAFIKPHTNLYKENSWLLERFIQYMNKIFVRTYQWVTKPYVHTYDKILYLYYFLPFAFRYMANFQKCKTQKKSGRSGI